MQVPAQQQPPSMEHKAKLYWNVSNAWNGVGSNMQVGDAIAALRLIKTTTNPATHIAKLSQALLWEIIIGEDTIDHANRSQ